MQKTCKNCEKQFENSASDCCSIDCTMENLEKSVDEFTSDILASNLSLKISRDGYK